MSTEISAAQDQVDRFLERFDAIPDLDYEVEAIVERIAKLARRIQRSHEETVGEFGLTYGEWSVLRSLKFAGADECSPGDLSSNLELSTGAMTSRLDKLEQRGFIKRLPDPKDRRGVKLQLTPAGDHAWVESANAQARKESLIAGALTTSEQQELNGLLRKLMLVFDDLK
jgi:DNA-binding MarR family transcriptional regulator